jgi:hypothetical protein
VSAEAERASADAAATPRAGRSCPTKYHYHPSAFRTASAVCAETVYVIGGLYGNREALHAILRMQEAEAREGRRVELVFNGDYHWFDVDAPTFLEIDQVAASSIAIRGNVETEIAEPSPSGCGCNYPDDVSDAFVGRSNSIMERLQETCRDLPSTRAALAARPMFRTIRVGDARIAIVHGDAESLAGWSFAAERLRAPGTDQADRRARTPLAAIERYFREADVRAFASTHTCLPCACDFNVDGAERLVINNGAAGLPNFAGTTAGLLSRISVDRRVPRESLYGIELGGLRFDAVPIRYDHTRWLESFTANWPPSSPAHDSYFGRIVRGPRYGVRDAVGGRVQLHS